MTSMGDLDRARLGELHATELARFRQARPRSAVVVVVTEVIGFSFQMRDTVT